MNEKFYALPEEKQQRILNAGFKVFSGNTYRKSPVGEIAAEAGISKSLLFHYFRNKRELYLFLWEKCAELTRESLYNDGCYETDEIFEAMYRGMESKFRIMRQFPDVGRFAIKAYYETDPEVSGDIAKYVKRYTEIQRENMTKWFKPDVFVNGLDMKMMYRDMFLASEGFIWEKLQSGNIDPDSFDREFRALIDFWKQIYLKRGEENDSD